MNEVAIIDYGMGNVLSVQRALARVGTSAVITDSANSMQRAKALVLPGVGAFASAMQELGKRNLLDPIKEFSQSSRPLLGICLGMQLFADLGYEGGEHSGLGLIPGITRRFLVNESQIKLPHVGWNMAVPKENARLFQAISRPMFYFVHSYHMIPTDSSYVAAYTQYGESFAASVEKDNIFGVQFHPEKSGKNGLLLLKNFVNLI